MKNCIEFFYKTNIDSFFEYDDNFYIYVSKGNYYAVTKYEDISALDNISKFNSIYNIIYTFDRNLFFIYNDIKYCVLKLSYNYDKEIDIDNIITFFSYRTRNIHVSQINWPILWEEKIDNIIYNFDNNYNLCENFQCIFHFYISQAENSLLYLKEVIKIFSNNYVDLSISHKRVLCSFTNLNYCNIFNLYEDVCIRDIAEYVKSCFYSGKDYESELIYFLNLNNLSSLYASLLFSRIMYPSFYFDSYLAGDVNSKFMDIKSYINFIKKTYEIINSYVKIIPFDIIN